LTNRNNSPATTKSKAAVRKPSQSNLSRSSGLTNRHVSAGLETRQTIFRYGSVVLGTAALTLMAAVIAIFGPIRIARQVEEPLKRLTRTPLAIGAARWGDKILTEAKSIRS
jgi:hypothetical protein